jgi:hypothetical protein
MTRRALKVHDHPNELGCERGQTPEHGESGLLCPGAIELVHLAQVHHQVPDSQRVVELLQSSLVQAAPRSEAGRGVIEHLRGEAEGGEAL